MIEDLAGNDPYDALRSPRIPRWVRSSRRGRQLAIQVRRRIPMDVSRLLAISPFIMAKTAACAVMSTSRLVASGARGASGTLQAQVEAMFASGGNLGNGRWGYEFDVQTRWAHYPAGSPNVIATCFAARALCEAGVVLERDDWLESAFASASAIRADLLCDDGRGSPYFCYVPASDVLVHNANALAAGIVAVVGVLAGDSAGVEVAFNCAQTTARAQNASGGWPYGVANALEWEDNFHTAYTLDGLASVWLATASPILESTLRSGCAAWERRFFGPMGEPYYTPGRGPFDIHSAATAVDVAARLASWNLCKSQLWSDVSRWTSVNLVDRVDGRPFFRRYSHFVDRRKFVRWGDAHWWLAQSSLELRQAGRPNPLEETLRRAAEKVTRRD